MAVLTKKRRMYCLQPDVQTSPAVKGDQLRRTERETSMSASDVRNVSV